jgi:hypothetical protein
MSGRVSVLRGTSAKRPEAVTLPTQCSMSRASSSSSDAVRDRICVRACRMIVPGSSGLGSICPTRPTIERSPNRSPRHIVNSSKTSSIVAAMIASFRSDT